MTAAERATALLARRPVHIICQCPKCSAEIAAAIAQAEEVAYDAGYRDGLDSQR